MKIRNPFKRSDKPAKAPDLGAIVRGTSLSYDDMARLLRTTPEALAAFEQAYGKAKLEEPKDEHDLFGTNSREAVAMRSKQGLSDEAEALCRRIVDELVAQTSVWSYDGASGTCEERYALPDGTSCPVGGELAARTAGRRRKGGMTRDQGAGIPHPQRHRRNPG